MSILYQLGRTFAFGGVRHEELGPIIRWVPISLGVLSAVIYGWLPATPRLIGDGGLSRFMLTVFSILPGFYIAALAAVATFNRDEVDSTMPAPAPQLKLRVGPNSEWVDLTFRMFLTHLFAYLTTLSFAAVFAFVGAELVSPSVKIWAAGSSAWATALPVTKYAYVLLVGWFVGKVILTTMVGLYFMAERMHRATS